MMPKIRVRPAASMNSNSPYCRLVSNWIRKLAKSMETGGQSQASPVRQGAGEGVQRQEMKSRGSAHAAACTGIGHGFLRDANHLVFLVLDLAQVHALDRVVGFAHGPL